MFFPACVIILEVLRGNWGISSPADLSRNTFLISCVHTCTLSWSCSKYPLFSLVARALWSEISYYSVLLSAKNVPAWLHTRNKETVWTLSQITKSRTYGRDHTFNLFAVMVLCPSKGRTVNLYCWTQMVWNAEHCSLFLEVFFFGRFFYSAARPITRQRKWGSSFLLLFSLCVYWEVRSNLLATMCS